jgi:hypothetical protein
MEKRSKPPGVPVHLAERRTRGLPERQGAAEVLSRWEEELEEARLAHEGTLCRDSMPESERSQPGSCRMPRIEEPPEPWRSFVADLASRLSEDVQL